ncbi:MAG: ribonuclease protein component [Bacillota bacterium]|jgi:ribonuclease P protein component
MYAVCRLRKSKDFHRVFRCGRSVVSSSFVLYIAKRRVTGEAARLGVSVSKRIGNAVVRGRLKRLVKESLREQMLTLPKNVDIVVIIRKEAVKLNFHRVKSILQSLLHRALKYIIIKR